MRLKGVFVLLVLLLSSIMFAAVSAVPDKAINVSGNQPAFTSTITKVILNNGSIFKYAGVATGTVDLTIGSITYKLTLTEEFSSSINTKTDQGESNRNITWRYIVGGQVLGAFEGQGKGVTQTTLYAPNGIPRGAFSTNVYHVVLQGSGFFDGQTLKLDGLRPTVDPTLPTSTKANPTTWTGTLLMH